MRRNEIDWLRDGAVLLLFLYHTAVVFDPFSDNYVKSAVHGYIAGGIVLAMFFWYMPFLFFLAGASAHFSLEKRSNGKFMKERIKRLLIPLLFGVAVIIPPQGYVAKLWRGIPTGGYLHHWGAFLTTFTNLSGYDGNFTPAQLWFILYLFIISAALLPFLRYLQSEKGRYFLLKIKPVMLTPAGIAIAAALLFITRILPDIGGKNIFYFALIYAFGSIIYSDGDYIKKMCTVKWCALIGILILIPAFLWSEYMLYNKYTMLWLKAAEAIITIIMMIFAIIALVGFGVKYLNRGGKALSYLNGACFPVYILHQTVLILAAYAILQFKLPIAIQETLIITITVPVTFALYEIARRIPPLCFLLGIKSAKLVKH